MAQFTAEVYQNEFLPQGGTDVHAIVTITCTGAGEAGRGEGGDAAEIIILDTSGSMQGDRFANAQQAAAAAIDQILDGTWFAVIAGTDQAARAFPYPNAISPMVRMEPGAREEAKRAVRHLLAGGGTAIGSWLRLATQLFSSVPNVTQRHAILLTDGKNQSESSRSLQDAIRTAQGVFQCDCRGVGADWDVRELRGIATALLGTVDLVAAPAQLASSFEEIMRNAMGRGVAQAWLRVWAPQGAQVLFVRQVVTQALVKALWSDDDALTTRINPAVAHYTGQAELAQAIQEGLAAKAAGDAATATTKLGRAVQLAAETGNDEATSRLRKVVEIDDPDTGTVRLRRNVDKLDEMALDTSSTKTTRVKR